MNQSLSVCCFSVALVVDMPLRSGRMSADTAVTGTARCVTDRRDTEFLTPDRFIPQAATWDDAIIDRRGEKLPGPKRKWNPDAAAGIWLDGEQSASCRTNGLRRLTQWASRTLPAGLSNEFVERWSVLFEQVLRPAVVIVDRREFRIDSQIVIQRRVNFRIRHRS